MKLDIATLAKRAALISGKDIDVHRVWLEEYTALVLAAALNAMRKSGRDGEVMLEAVEDLTP